MGSFGIECLSRGAEKVTFIEKDDYVVNILKKNLIHLSLLNKSVIIKIVLKIFKCRIKTKIPIFSLTPLLLITIFRKFKNY